MHPPTCANGGSAQPFFTVSSLQRALACPFIQWHSHLPKLFYTLKMEKKVWPFTLWNCSSVDTLFEGQKKNFIWRNVSLISWETLYSCPWINVAVDDKWNINLKNLEWNFLPISTIIQSKSISLLRSSYQTLWWRLWKAAVDSHWASDQFYLALNMHCPPNIMPMQQTLILSVSFFINIITVPLFSIHRMNAPEK